MTASRGTTITLNPRSRHLQRLRNVIGGTSTAKGLREYLILLGVSETCKCKGVRFLDFLSQSLTWTPLLPITDLRFLAGLALASRHTSSDFALEAVDARRTVSHRLRQPLISPPRTSASSKRNRLDDPGGKCGERAKARIITQSRPRIARKLLILFGGERGIRTLEGSTEPASYRFPVAVGAASAGSAVAHYPKLPK
jgi:hypothetical protein